MYNKYIKVRSIEEFENLLKYVHEYPWFFPTIYQNSLCSSLTVSEFADHSLTVRWPRNNIKKRGIKNN